MLERLDEGLWVHAIPHTMMGLHLGSRLTVVRLEDGSLLVHSPVKLTGELKDEVDALGEVTHVVMPNAFHHVYAKPWIEAYPDATTHGAQELRNKRKDLRIDETLGAEPHPDWEGTLEPIPIAGCMLEETVFLHPASRTLITVDLIESFVDGVDHLPTRLYLKAAGIHGKTGFARPLRMLYRDKAAARRDIEGIVARDFDRVILSHGSVVESDGPRRVREAYAGWLL